MTNVSFQYAEAIFALASEKHSEHEILAIYETFLSVFNENLRNTLLHPKITKVAKKEIVGSLKLGSLFTHFLFVLIDKNRIGDLDSIYVEFKRLIDHKENVLRVVVTSKIPLSKEQLLTIESSLEKKHKRRVIIETRIDPKIVGGLKFAYEGNVVDHTINHYINSLSDALKA